MKLIDADTLAKVKFHECPETEITSSGVDVETYKRGWNDAITSIIAMAPTIDAVPVVRCAECKWFQCNMSMDGYLPKGVDEFECRHWCGPCDPDDFCSYGEREEE